MDKRHYDFVIVGSGINSLVCAALLAKKGHKVCVLERNDRLGGCIRTEEITLPGFRHEVFSAVHPLVVTSPVFAELQEDFFSRGLEYCSNDYPTGVVLPDNRSLVFRMDRQANAAAMEALAEGDGSYYVESMQYVEKNSPLIFGLLGNKLWSFATLKLFAGELWKRGVAGMLNFVSEAMQTNRDWLEAHYSSDLVKAQFAPWVLHAGLGPESAFSGLMSRVMAFTLEQAGAPVVKGGNEKLVDIYAEIIRDHGGEMICNVDVAEITLEGTRATGVKDSSGIVYSATKSVICNVTPTQLYQRLLPEAMQPPEVRKQANEYRYGRAMMTIHLALDEPPQWAHPDMQKVVMLHVTPDLDGISKATNEADRGFLPDQSTIVVCQPTAVDPSRAPEGKWIFWIQLQQIPRILKGDARGEIATPEDGQWNDSIRDQFADRILAQLAEVIPNLKRSLLAMKAYSPKDLEAMNINLVGGDAYGGDCGLDQFLFWRPLKAMKNHETPVKNLYHIGASTHPGPGLGGGSGYLVAKQLA